MIIKRYLLLLLFFVMPVISADDVHVMLNASDYERAGAVIQPTKGNTVYGVFRFEQLPDGVKISAILTGLTPNQNHGVHIHEWGDLTDLKAGKSAGGHYNPDKHPHGLPPNPIRQAGSFGNIKANDKGEAMFEFIDDIILLKIYRENIKRNIKIK